MSSLGALSFGRWGLYIRKRVYTHLPVQELEDDTRECRARAKGRLDPTAIAGASSLSTIKLQVIRVHLWEWNIKVIRSLLAYPWAYQGCRAPAQPVIGQDLDLAITLPTAWVQGQDRDMMYGVLCLHVKPQTCTNVR
jgi:hypothetical protein